LELARVFDSPCVINVVKTKRVCYAGHMIEGYFYSKTGSNEAARKIDEPFVS
jgi:hypothetical protein